MGLKFNPLSLMGFDIAGAAAGAVTWTGSVATEAALSTTGNTDGDAKVALDTDYIWIWDASTSRWINQGIKAAALGSTPGSQGYSLDYVNVASNRRELRLTLQPADATNPGAVTTGAQTLAGSKTFSSVVNANGGIDVTATGGTDSLNIGFTNADVINIGRSGATVNVIGTTAYQDVTNYEVEDKNITINKGGSAASATAAGLDVEENAVITGYVNTAADRNSWELKAPNTAGVAVITPGAGGITLNQTSHNPVTLGTANGLSLSTQALSLQAASGSQPGALASADWTTFNNKQAAGNYITALTGDVTASGPGSVASTIAAGVIVNSMVSGSAAIDFSKMVAIGSGQIILGSAGTVPTPTTVTGDITINSGGTTAISSGVIVNDDVNASAAIAVSKLAAMTASRAVVSDGSGFISPATTTATEIGYVNGVTSAIQTQLDTKATKSAGDIAETSFSVANNQSSVANVTGLAFANGSVRSFKAHVSVQIDATSDLFEVFSLIGIQRGADWALSYEGAGDTSGIAFSITNAGQVQYTSLDYTGFASATAKFRAEVTV